MAAPRTPEGRARALANLRRGGPGRPRVPKELSMLEVRIRELTPASPQVRGIARQIIAIQQELAAPTPADAPLVGMLSLTLAVVKMAAADLLQHGLEGPNGRERPSARIFADATKRALELCAALGIGPVARSRLGLGGARSLDELLREALAHPGPTGESAPAPEAENAGGEAA